MTTVASQITSLFTQSFIQTQMKESIKAPRHWPLCGEFTGTGDFPAQRASNAEYVSIWWRHHVVTDIICEPVCNKCSLGVCLLSSTIERKCRLNSTPQEKIAPDSKIHGAYMGPIWGRQDPGGHHVGPMNFAICGVTVLHICGYRLDMKYSNLHNIYGVHSIINDKELLVTTIKFFIYICYFKM